MSNLSTEMTTTLESCTTESEVEENFRKFKIQISDFAEQMKACKENYTIAMEEKKYELLLCVHTVSLGDDFDYMMNKLSINYHFS